jgi:NAD(P)-dependent dehydrogenase (short-subunit alcohol dehydrogenase family)
MERQKEASLAGKVAIVTGSSRGIGKRAALALARRGARLVVTARTVEASGTELPGTIGQTVKEIESLGGEAVAVAADLSNEQELGDRQDAKMISMDVPARVLAYFAACENPLEYTGRVFFAERELAALGLTTDD